MYVYILSTDAQLQTNMYQMVDTVTCLTEGDLTEKFFEKLLLGAIDKAVDHEIIPVTNSTPTGNNGHEQFSQYPSPPQQPGHPETIYEHYAPKAGQYGHPSFPERRSDPQTTTLHSIQAVPSSTPSTQITPRYAPQMEQFNQQSDASLLRQSTSPQETAELPIHPAPRSRTFGTAKNVKKAGWRPWS